MAQAIQVRFGGRGPNESGLHAFVIPVTHCCATLLPCISGRSKEFSVISIGGTCYRTRAVGGGGQKPVLDETLVLDPVNLHHTDIDIQVPPGSRVWVDLQPCPSPALPDEQRTPQQSSHDTPSLRLRVYHHWSARNTMDPAGSSTQQHMQHHQQLQQQQQHTHKLHTLVDGVQGLADKLGLWPCLDPANWVTAPRLAHLVGVLCDPLGHLLDTHLRHREDLTVHSTSPSSSETAAAAAAVQAQLPCSCGLMACGPAEALCAPGDMLPPLPVGPLSPAMAKAWSRKTL